MSSTTWNLRIANVHLLAGRRPVLVDSGPPAGTGRLLALLRARGIEPADLGALVLTHGHADHAGGAAAFVALGVPVLLGAADLPLTAAGRNPEVSSTGLSARVLRRVLPWTYPPFTPTHLVEGSADLAPYGLDGEMRVVGGHSPGSSVVIADDLLVAGDLVRGGHLGGTLLRGRARIHYYSDDPASDLRTVAGLIDEHRPRRVLLGHGGPLDADAARRRIDELARRLDVRSRSGAQ